MASRRALILVGGSWHDFEGFVESTRSLLTDWSIESTYDLDAVLSLESSGYDLVIGDTCFARYNDGREEPGPVKMTDEQIRALRAWVRNGGAFLPYHSGTVLGDSNFELAELTGGVFVEHPPEFTFAVYPVYGEHPITEGIEVFSVYDEFYKERIVAPVDVHLIGIDRGVAFPLAWSKQEGDGRVAHIALGHSRAVWDHPTYQRLMLNTVEWLT